MHLASLLLFLAFFECAGAQLKEPAANGTITSNRDLCIRGNRNIAEESDVQVANFTEGMVYRSNPPEKDTQRVREKIHMPSVKKAMRKKKAMMKAWEMPSKPAPCPRLNVSTLHMGGWHWNEECPERINYVDVYFDWGLGRKCLIINSCLNRVWWASCTEPYCCERRGQCYPGSYRWVYFVAYCPPNLGKPTPKPWVYIRVRRLWLPHCCVCWTCTWWHVG